MIEGFERRGRYRETSSEKKGDEDWGVFVKHRGENADLEPSTSGRGWKTRKKGKGLTFNRKEVVMAEKEGHKSQELGDDNPRKKREEHKV